jgi:hypothetical protein
LRSWPFEQVPNKDWQFFFQKPVLLYTKRSRILRRFKKYQLTLVTKCTYHKFFPNFNWKKMQKIGTPTIPRTTNLRMTNLRTTNLRTTNPRRRPFSERPFSESDHSPNDQSPKTTNPRKTDYCQAVSKLLHILPDFLSLLHLIFHLYHRRQVLNCMDWIVIKSRVSAWFILLGLG